MSGCRGIGVGMENDLAAIASRAERHASEPRCRAEDLVYEAWEAAGPRRAALARKAVALWPDCADGYVLLAQAASSLEEARELLERGVAAGERAWARNASTAAPRVGTASRAGRSRRTGRRAALIAGNASPRPPSAAAQSPAVVGAGMGDARAPERRASRSSMTTEAGVARVRRTAPALRPTQPS